MHRHIIQHRLHNSWKSSCLSCRTLFISMDWMLLHLTKRSSHFGGSSTANLSATALVSSYAATISATASRMRGRFLWLRRIAATTSTFAAPA